MAVHLTIRVREWVCVCGCFFLSYLTAVYFFCFGICSLLEALSHTQTLTPHTIQMISPNSLLLVSLYLTFFLAFFFLYFFRNNTIPFLQSVDLHAHTYITFDILVWIDRYLYMRTYIRTYLNSWTNILQRLVCVLVVFYFYFYFFFSLHFLPATTDIK